MQLISIDWGTSSFRASRWTIRQPVRESVVIERLETNKGLLFVNTVLQNSDDQALFKNRFETCLMDTIGHWINQTTTILMSGMVGSKSGWLEAPYVCAPATVEQLAAQLVEIPLFAPDQQKVRAYIVPGVSQNAPPDVMRGEETQLFGLDSDHPINQLGTDYAQLPTEESLFILPGTHSKHVKFANAQIIQFKTYMTGELFGLLTTHSILAGLCKPNNFEQTSFETGVSQALKASDLTAQLFSLRAKSLINNEAGFCTSSALSGLLIGSELKDLSSSAKVHLVGSDALCDRYSNALRLLNIKHHIEKNKSAELGALRIALKAKLLEV
jgi:2-dehydro-3-deoxygalactonokinase